MIATQAENAFPAATKESRRILVVEDDPDIAALLALHLSDHYAHVQTTPDGLEGLRLAQSDEFDLLILDIRLPGMDGLEICRQVRANQQYVPIIMLTSKSSELDHVLGLEMGADDYVTKPFSVMTLMSRVKALFRRAAMKTDAMGKNADQISHGDIQIQVSKRQVSIGGLNIELTAKEFDLLCHFVNTPGEVFSRAVLLDQVWGYGHEGYEHTVNSHINRLRIKIEDDPTKPTRIITVWGVGYKLGE